MLKKQYYLGRMKANAIANKPRFKNPSTRVVQANPIFGRSSRVRMGYTMPPNKKKISTEGHDGD